MLRQFVFFVFIVGLAIQIGCEDPPQIQQYEVPKSRSDLGDIGLKIETPAQPSVLTRMVVAIAERDDATWFFKLTGPVDAVSESKEQWSRLFTSLEFGSDGRPKWTAPESWTLGPAKPMRFATLFTEIENIGKVELSISSLGPNQSLLDNVNRWLNQLGKPPLKKEELKLDSLVSAAGDLKIFDDTGMMNSTSMSIPQTPREPEFTHKEMPGWSKKPNPVAAIKFVKGDEKRPVELTVTPLLAAANEWVPNVQRWAGQVNIDADEEYIKNNSVKVTIDEIEGDKIRLVPDDDKAENALIGIMVVRGNLAWFFKIIGGREKVIELEPEFDAFVDSFHFN